MDWRIVRALSAAVLLLAGGCSTVVVRDDPKSVYVSDSAKVDAAPLVEALVENFRQVRVQALDATWKGRPFTAEVVLKGDGEKMTVVFLAPQMRLATITLSRPHRIEYERAPRVPESFAPEYAVVDLAFVLLPETVLAAALGPAFAVKDDGARRELICGGEVVRSLERRGGEIQFSNPTSELECRIVTVK